MSASQRLPNIDQVPLLPKPFQHIILNDLFEPAPALRQHCLPVLLTPAESWHALIYDGVGKAIADLHQASLDASNPDADAAREALDSILGSHPRLGAKKVDSAASSAEQAHLQSGGSQEESKRLAELNEEYEAKFPGLRFVVFVNGRPRSEIMDIMKQRIDRGDIEEERRASIQAMVDIAWDRAQKKGASS